ncbi:hypothetical protein LMG19282_00148 [Cupriavidus campinensis]|uniref:hypothetical protein n=1 Tax=Cupriavidus campinensis TaxID=151783 RepID=UPI00164300C3|nr:hypothetical protein [Cupriavidus campinensis]CAG2129244.1 hypothetical protein LMG19282_00148 [Cupriavidus campinensis]
MARVATVPTVHIPSASAWLSGATTVDSSRMAMVMAMVMVPKKFPATGCRYSLASAAG